MLMDRREHIACQRLLQGHGRGSVLGHGPRIDIPSLRTTRHGFPLWARVITVSSLPLSIRRPSSAGGVWFSRQPSTTCRANRPERPWQCAREPAHRCQCHPPPALAVSGDGDDLRHRGQGADRPCVASDVIALRDEHLHAHRQGLVRVADGADEREGHLAGRLGARDEFGRRPIAVATPRALEAAPARSAARTATRSAPES